MNDTLLDQCRREADNAAHVLRLEIRAALPKPINEPTSEIIERRLKDHAEGYAAALYHERSKRPPTVEGPPMISVEEAMAVLKPWIAKHSEDGEVLWHVLPEEKADGITKYEADLRNRLTAAATNNTNDNG